MEVLDFTPGPGGSYPLGWGYRPGEDWRTVLLGGIPVTLATSYASGSAVLLSNAAPHAAVNVIGHDRWPDFNTMPAGPGTTHSQIRAAVRLALAGTGPSRRAYLAGAAAGLAAGLGDGGDLIAAYARPLTRALAVSLGFPETDWDSCVLAPASVQQGLLGAPGGEEAARRALDDLLGYCQQLARELDEDSVLGRVAAGLRARRLSHLTWHVLRTLATGSITPDKVLAARLAGRPWYFGLMNPRDMPGGPVIVSMDAMMHDPARRGEGTLAWGLGPHACPVYRDSRALLEEADAALGGGWVIAGGLEIVPGLLPVPAALPVIARSPALAR